MGQLECACRVREHRCRSPGFLEAKRGSQVTKRASPPIANVGFTDASEFLQKLEHRGVIERLAADPSSGRPWRNNDAGDPEPAADRKTVDKLVGCPVWRDRRRYVIEKPVVLVVVKDECGLRPHIRIGRNRVDFASHKCGSIGWHEVRMFRLKPGWKEPRNGRQFVMEGVVLELTLRSERNPFSMERRPFVRLLERLKVLQHVELVTVLILVDFPAHA